MLKQTVQPRDAVSANHTDAGFDTLHPVLRRVLSNRDIHTAAEIDHSLKHLLPPAGLKNIAQASARIARAIEKNESILIVGDYDADGATATTLAILGLRSMGAQHVDYTVPNRFSDGYGLSLKLAKKIGRHAPNLVITVDNGISSVDGIAYLKAQSVDVVVTDHHLAGDTLPDACSIVNPNQPGCGFESKMLAGVGVMFYVLLACRQVLQDADYFSEHELNPHLLELLDLVALGTVADVVPLDRNNRILVAQGVARMRAGRLRPGIAALMRVAKRKPESLVSQDLGFVLGPRLNASGRLDNISTGIECLLAEDMAKADEFARALNDINIARKDIEQSMQKQASAAVEAMAFGDQASQGVVLYDESWHEGVVGLVASRIKDKLGVPALVFAMGEDGLLKGSSRSIPEVHIRDVLALVDAKHPDIITRFGGHAMAAGLSIHPQHLDVFSAAFERETATILASHPPANTLLTDGELSAEELNQKFAEKLKGLIPWGQGCPEPTFSGEFEVLNARFVGGVHLKMVLRPQHGSVSIDAIYFRYIRSAESEDKRQALELRAIKAVYRLDVNQFRGQKSLQLILAYLQPI